MLIFITSQNVWIEICHYCYHHCHCNIWLNFYCKQDLRNYYIFLVSTNYIDRESDLIFVYFLLISSMFSPFFSCQVFSSTCLGVIFSPVQRYFSFSSPSSYNSSFVILISSWNVGSVNWQKWMMISRSFFPPPHHQFFMIM